VEGRIESNFKGFINGVLFRNENAYFMVGNILSCYEDVFGQYDNAEIVRILLTAYETYANQGKDVNKLEEACIKNIQERTVKFLPRAKSMGGLNKELERINNQYETV
jgi:hypothetical protein